MSHHKRKGPKSTRRGCLLCKPHKRQGVDAPTRQEQRARESEKYSDLAQEERELVEGLIPKFQKVKPMQNLEDLKCALILDEFRSRESDEPASFDWCELPNFGGEVPNDTTGIWSWDATRLLIGTCTEDLEIIERDTD